MLIAFIVFLVILYGVLAGFIGYYVAAYYRTPDEYDVRVPHVRERILLEARAEWEALLVEARREARLAADRDWEAHLAVLRRQWEDEWNALWEARIEEIKREVRAAVDREWEARIAALRHEWEAEIGWGRTSRGEVQREEVMVAAAPSAAATVAVASPPPAAPTQAQVTTTISIEWQPRVDEAQRTTQGEADQALDGHEARLPERAQAEVDQEWDQRVAPILAQDGPNMEEEIIEAHKAGTEAVNSRLDAHLSDVEVELSDGVGEQWDSQMSPIRGDLNEQEERDWEDPFEEAQGSARDDVVARVRERVEQMKQRIRFVAERYWAARLQAILQEMSGQAEPSKPEIDPRDPRSYTPFVEQLITRHPDPLQKPQSNGTNGHTPHGEER